MKNISNGAWGNETAFLAAAASRPVRWRASLGPVDGESRVEMQDAARRSPGHGGRGGGRRHCQSRPLAAAPLAKAGGGTGRFSPSINWDRSPDLYYNVTGAPPSVCGDLYISRNGSPYVPTAGWICTDPSGNATKGPWTWAGQSGTEIAFAYIVWPGGLSTNTDQHNWDKTPPSATITSPMASPAPISFFGNGSDVGAGFSPSWGSSCSNYFYDKTTDDYWDPVSNRYSNAFFPFHVACTISGMPSTSVTWSQSKIPRDSPTSPATATNGPSSSTSPANPPTTGSQRSTSASDLP